MKTFKKGELMTVSHGEYSDYCVMGLFRVLVDFNAEEVLQVWVKESGPGFKSRWNGDNGYAFDKGHELYGETQTCFLGWLNLNGFIQDVDYRELHIGNYGSVRLDEAGVSEE